MPSATLAHSHLHSNLPIARIPLLYSSRTDSTDGVPFLAALRQGTTIKVTLYIPAVNLMGPIVCQGVAWFYFWPLHSHLFLRTYVSLLLAISIIIIIPLVAVVAIMHIIHVQLQLILPRR